MSRLFMYCENEEKRKLWMAVGLIEPAVEEVADVRVRLSALSFSRFCPGLWQMIWGLLVVDDKMQFSMLQYNCQLSANLSQQLSFSCSLSSEWKQNDAKHRCHEDQQGSKHGTSWNKFNRALCELMFSCFVLPKILTFLTRQPYFTRFPTFSL